MKRACMRLSTNTDEQNVSYIRSLKINLVRMKHLITLLMILVVMAGRIDAQWTRMLATIDSAGTLAPTIDGVADDSIWKVVPKNQIERLFANDSAVWGTKISINEDMKGYWKAAWTKEGIYIMVVTESDDTIPALGTYGEAWEQERVQVYFDLGIDSLEDGKSNSNDGTYHPVVNVTRYPSAKQSLPGFSGGQYAITVNEDYSGVTEFYIPWSVLKTRSGMPYIPSSIQPLGFDVILVDNDGPANPPARTRRFWCSFTDPYFDSDSTGRILFEGGIDTLQPVKPVGPQEINVKDYKIIGYIPTYRWSSISSIDFRRLTHVNISFANPTANGTMNFGANITTLKNAIGTANTKIMISIGGGAVDAATATNYTNLLKDANRAAFIEKIMEFVNTNGLDGVDIDLEGSLVEVPEYNKFVTEMSAKLHEAGKKVSIAIPNWSGGLIDDVTYNALDWINIMSYDLTGPWAPASPGQHAPYSKYLSDFNYFNESRGIHGSKIVMGVPFYGYEFVSASSANSQTYCQIIENNAGAEYSDVVNGKLFYNGRPTIIKKTEFVKKYAGGIMIWELGQDCFEKEESLLALIDSVYGLNIPDAIISVKDIHSPQLYPNPFTNSVNVRLPKGKDNAFVEFYNLLGEKVYSHNLRAANSRVNLSALPKGMYIIRLGVDGQKYNFKAVKE